MQGYADEIEGARAEGLEFEVGGLTDVGQVRDFNEDAFHISEGARLFVVADGMGGEAAGEVASALAVEGISDFFRLTGEDTDVTWPLRPEAHDDLPSARLATGVQVANQRIFEASQEARQCRGMGTTVVALHFDGHRAYVAHVGDSRVYRLQGGHLEQITRDHSLLEQLKSLRPNMTQAEIDAFPYKHVIVRALGKDEEVEVDLWSGVVGSGDVFLLCSDGLSGMISDEEIAGLLSTEAPPRLICRQLIEAANAAGGKDNITAVIVQVK